MSWVVAGIAGGGAVLGAFQKSQEAQQQREQQRQQMLANATQIQMSPWTGAAAQVQGYGNTPGAGGAALSGAMSGGLTGAMFGSQFGKSAAAPTGMPSHTVSNDAQSQLEEIRRQQGLGPVMTS